VQLNEDLKLLQTIDCQGKTPRDFIFVGDYLFSANQDSDNVSILTPCDNNFILKEQVTIKSPICIVYA
jgi:6-phosphogluconolactonase (cycloisomerase 2 family)